MHLEQKDYDKDRDKLISEWKKKLKVIVTSCADIADWKLTKELVSKYKGFVFATAGVHPQYVNKYSDEEVGEFIKVLKKEKKNIVGIGEVGLDFHWIKDEKLREKQKEWFVKFIRLARELEIPLVVHSWSACLECVEILEEQGMIGRKVLLHMFGDNKLVERIAKNGWHVSIGPGIQRSKTTRKIARDMPLNLILMETDSPWFGDGERGTPLNVFKAAEKAAEIRRISVEELEKQTDLNATKFFGLKKR